MVSHASSHELREDLEKLVNGGTEQSGQLRNEIASSWRRSLQLGLHPDEFVVPYEPDVATPTRLAWAAQPVLNQLAQDLDDSGIGLLLTDERGHVVDRRSVEPAVMRLFDRISLAPGFHYGEDRIGTNAIGIATADAGGPSVVTGSEHFAEALTGTACVAIPIAGPGGDVLGVIDLTCTTDHAHPLMLPMAKRAARDIEERLRADSSSARKRMLRAEFDAARRTTRDPLILLSPDTMLANPAAARLLDSADREQLWDLIAPALSGDGLASRRLLLGDGSTAAIHWKSVGDGREAVGALIRLTRMPEPTAAEHRTQATAVAQARHRIQRDLHDGLQQQLFYLGLSLNQAKAAVPNGNGQLATKLEDIAYGLQDTLDNLRKISHGAAPGVVSRNGLRPAMQMLARRSPVPVGLDLRIEGRFPEPIESGVYYLVSEALANVAKHARATLARVGVTRVDGFLEVTVQDDGLGGADPHGSGLTGLMDRIEALGGTMRVVSPPGGGTLVHARLPIASGPADEEPAAG